jgi:TetR/AcrR family transcriptional regulator
MAAESTAHPEHDASAASSAKKPRVKAGERRTQILHTMAQMLETPAHDKITTAAIAKKLDVSEAALYRHFASKAQMYEGLIGFIEETVFGLINRIATDEPDDGLKQLHATVAMLLNFSAKNVGLTRVLVGDALVGEHARLQSRVNQLVDRIEASIKQSMRIAITQQALPADYDVASHANLIACYIMGRWHQFAKSGYKKSPVTGFEKQLPVMIG